MKLENIDDRKEEIKKKIMKLKLVEIRELSTNIGSVFLLKIGGENIRLYLSRNEADIVEAYMTKAILEVIVEFLRDIDIDDSLIDRLYNKFHEVVRK